MKWKTDVVQGRLALMVGHTLLEAETRDLEQTAAILARFFEEKAEDFQ